MVKKQRSTRKDQAWEPSVLFTNLHVTVHSENLIDPQSGIQGFIASL